MFGLRSKRTMVEPERALPGRENEMPVAARHAVLGTPLKPPFPEGYEQAIVGMGCFWGAERVFWQAPGVYTTAVGYSGGITPNPTYKEVCSGRTGHTEAVLVVFDPARTSYEEILRLFWENHDPTQGMRQGNDIGTQYRSAIYWTSDEQRAVAEATRDAFAERLRAARYPEITTEIASAGPFYYAEDYHQQYLEKHPWGYCGLGGTGVSCPVGIDATSGAGSERPASPRARTRTDGRRLARAELHRPRNFRHSAPCPPRKAGFLGVEPNYPSLATEPVTNGGNFGSTVEDGGEAQPPATAGRIVTSSPSETGVSRPSRKRMSSPPTYTLTNRRSPPSSAIRLRNSP